MTDVMSALPRKTRELHNHHMDSTIWDRFAFRDDDIIVGLQDSTFITDKICKTNADCSTKLGLPHGFTCIQLPGEPLVRLQQPNPRVRLVLGPACVGGHDSVSATQRTAAGM